MALQQVFSHKLADLYFDSEKSYFEERWKTESEWATDEEFKSFQYEKIEVAKKYLPKLFLCDTRYLKYVIVPEMQEWLDKVVLNFWNTIGLEKCAFLISTDLFTQVSLEQAMTENAQKFIFRYFDDETQALRWLIANDETKN